MVQAKECPDSVTGIISIPGMMTGALLGGSSVEKAVKLQSKGACSFQKH